MKHVTFNCRLDWLCFAAIIPDEIVCMLWHDEQGLLSSCSSHGFGNAAGENCAGGHD